MRFSLWNRRFSVEDRHRRSGDKVAQPQALDDVGGVTQKIRRLHARASGRLRVASLTPSNPGAPPAGDLTACAGHWSTCFGRCRAAPVLARRTSAICSSTASMRAAEIFLMVAIMLFYRRLPAGSKNTPPAVWAVGVAGFHGKPICAATAGAMRCCGFCSADFQVCVGTARPVAPGPLPGPAPCLPGIRRRADDGGRPPIRYHHGGGIQKTRR